ncbi:internal virion protein [Xylella phage Paz]|uniref:Internal virion protein n=1 Tax=Xylella phage Paz TaxID=1415145 RepID=V5Q7R4_9CAUD|nr:internal virion protein [Xylella phage Paz]AHB12133.1 internal virion protein [Xylella phage Paz]
MDGLGTILQANNITRVARAKYQSAVATQAANNKLKKAQGDLANWSRSLSNRRRVEAAQKEFNRGVEQLSNETRQAGKQATGITLDSSEQRGALLARAAMTGVGGSTVEAMENLINLQAATSQEEIDQAVDNMQYSAKQNLTTALMNTYMSQDFSQTMMDFDFTKHIEPQGMKRRLGKLVGVAVATYFGGPMAGEAVSNLAVGEWQATNGDFQGANQSFGAAMTQAGGAMQQWSDRGGTAWGEDVWRGMRANGSNAGAASIQATGGMSTKKAQSASSSSKSWFK